MMLIRIFEEEDDLHTESRAPSRVDGTTRGELSSWFSAWSQEKNQEVDLNKSNKRRPVVDNSAPVQEQLVAPQPRVVGKVKTSHSHTFFTGTTRGESEEAAAGDARTDRHDDRDHLFSAHVETARRIFSGSSTSDENSTSAKTASVYHYGLRSCARVLLSRQAVLVGLSFVFLVFYAVHDFRHRMFPGSSSPSTSSGSAPLLIERSVGGNKYGPGRGPRPRGSSRARGRSRTSTTSNKVSFFSKYERLCQKLCPNHETLEADIKARRLPRQNVFLTGPWYPNLLDGPVRQYLFPETEFIAFFDHAAADESIRLISDFLEEQKVFHDLREDDDHLSSEVRLREKNSTLNIHPNEASTTPALSTRMSPKRPWTLSRAYQEVNPRAFRADIWRIAIVYFCGGLYVDAKATWPETSFTAKVKEQSRREASKDQGRGGARPGTTSRRLAERDVDAVDLWRLEGVQKRKDAASSPPARIFGSMGAHIKQRNKKVDGGEKDDHERTDEERDKDEEDVVKINADPYEQQLRDSEARPGTSFSTPTSHFSASRVKKKRKRFKSGGKKEKSKSRQRNEPVVKQAGSKIEEQRDRGGVDEDQSGEGNKGTAGSTRASELESELSKVKMNLSTISSVFEKLATPTPPGRGRANNTKNYTMSAGEVLFCLDHDALAGGGLTNRLLASYPRNPALLYFLRQQIQNSMDMRYDFGRDVAEVHIPLLYPTGPGLVTSVALQEPCLQSTLVPRCAMAKGAEPFRRYQPAAVVQEVCGEKCPAEYYDAVFSPEYHDRFTSLANEARKNQPDLCDEERMLRDLKNATTSSSFFRGPFRLAKKRRKEGKRSVDNQESAEETTTTPRAPLPLLQRFLDDWRDDPWSPHKVDLRTGLLFSWDRHVHAAMHNKQNQDSDCSNYGEIFRHHRVYCSELEGPQDHCRQACLEAAPLLGQERDESKLVPRTTRLNKTLYRQKSVSERARAALAEKEIQHRMGVSKAYATKTLEQFEFVISPDARADDPVAEKRRLTLEMPVLPYVVQAQHSYFISALKLILEDEENIQEGNGATLLRTITTKNVEPAPLTPTYQDNSFFPYGGTHLAAARYGSLVGYTGSRYNFVDFDTDYLVWVKKEEGEPQGRATRRFFKALVEDYFGNDLAKPGPGDPALGHWAWRAGEVGRSCILVDLDGAAGVPDLPYAYWPSENVAAIRDSELQRGDILPEPAGWIGEKFRRHDSHGFRLYADVCVIEYDEKVGKACLDANTKDLSVRFWLDNKTNCIRDEVLPKLLPPKFASAARLADKSAWQMLKADGHTLQTPGEVLWATTTKLARKDKYNRSPPHPGAGREAASSVFSSSSPSSNINAQDDIKTPNPTSRLVSNYCMPPAGVIVSGEWWNTTREAPLGDQECEAILEHIAQVSSPLAPFCRSGIDVDCKYVAGERRGGFEVGRVRLRNREKKQSQLPYHPTIPRAHHDPKLAREHLQGLHRASIAGAKRVVAKRPLMKHEGN
ncbi:unnamed protein product [Amoebophrya sp. A120]|nr:unnamed protein product [Amoebophrya sp. A120]|eukprot:GSA120T00001161001.1